MSGNFHDANYNVTKIRTEDGNIAELELNGKNVPLTTGLEDNKAETIDVSTYTEPVVINPSSGKTGMKKATVTLSNISSGSVNLKAFKSSHGNVIYSSSIPQTEQEDMTVYLSSVKIKTLQADYNLEENTDSWKYGQLYYDANYQEITPQGTEGTPVELGTYVLYSINRGGEIESHYWKVETVEGTKHYYMVLELGKTPETMVISETEDVSMKPNLDTRTPQTLSYILFTLAAGFTCDLNPGGTPNVQHFERYSTDDVTIE